MQLHETTKPIAERRRSPLVGRTLACVGMLVLGCSRPPDPESDEDDPQPLPDAPADVPTEKSELFEGILYGDEATGSPTQFWECASAEVFELSYAWQQGGIRRGTCDGVYNRVRGRLDRTFEPPRLFVHETLEARWSEPEDCSFYFDPQYDSCAVEEAPDGDAGDIVELPCQLLNHPPLVIPPGVCGWDRCEPVRFYATEIAGWKHFHCGADELALSGPFGECEFIGDSDTCLEEYRCWNPAGDMTMPGVCVPYCDVTGELGSCFQGTCVRCSSSDRWGLCMTDCSGEDCNVDGFC